MAYKARTIIKRTYCRVITVLIATAALYCLYNANSEFYADSNPNSNKMIMPTALQSIPHLFLGVTKTKKPKIREFEEMRKRLDKSGLKLSIFKGPKAELNYAVLLVLQQNGPLVIFDITKEIRKWSYLSKKHYSVVNRRARALLGQGFVEIVGSRPLLNGSQGALYQLTVRAQLVFSLSGEVTADQFVREADDDALTTGLAAMALFMGKDRSYHTHYMSFLDTVHL